ncbi:AtpZ/AtpI family protein [Larkinella harenae]
MSQSQEDKGFGSLIQRIEERKLREKARPRRSVWMGLGVMGMVGWAIALPTMLGTALGIWLDRISPQSFSWTLTLLIGGLMLGCGLAYQWLIDEESAINDKKKKRHEQLD